VFSILKDKTTKKSPQDLHQMSSNLHTSFLFKFSFVLCHGPQRSRATTERKITFVGGSIGKLAFVIQVSDVALGPLV
jgi:hypothetical protein